MQNKLTQNWGSSTTWLRFFIIVLLLLGIFFRFVFSVLIAIGQGIYVVITERFRFNKTIAAYLLASLAGFLTFIYDY
jgi:hypothetical protein